MLDVVMIEPFVRAHLGTECNLSNTYVSTHSEWPGYV